MKSPELGKHYGHVCILMEKWAICEDKAESDRQRRNSKQLLLLFGFI